MDWVSLQQLKDELGYEPTLRSFAQDHWSRIAQFRVTGSALWELGNYGFSEIFSLRQYRVCRNQAERYRQYMRSRR